jgi:hypothetical protein
MNRTIALLLVDFVDLTDFLTILGVRNRVVNDTSLSLALVGVPISVPGVLEQMTLRLVFSLSADVTAGGVGVLVGRFETVSSCSCTANGEPGWAEPTTAMFRSRTHCSQPSGMLKVYDVAAGSVFTVLGCTITINSEWNGAAVALR